MSRVGAQPLPYHPDLAFSLPAGSTFERYIEGLCAAGIRTCQGSGRTYWVASGDHVVRRLPTFHVGTPSEAEVDSVLRTTGAVIASYIRAPDDSRVANAWLYLCSDHEYSLNMRPPAMRRNVRRAFRQLTIAPLTVTSLLAHGWPAFCDTRRRAGLDDGTVRGFRRYFENHVHAPGRSYLGAWKNGRLAAFATAVHVDDWAELSCFSMNSTLWHRPNDALLYVALSKYLAEQGCRVVSYGLSSIQARSNAAGLHRFKQKVGFNPIRVHRAFVLHPSLRPFANRATLTAASWVVNGALGVRPGHPGLRKLGGMLACMRGPTWMIHAADGSHPARRDRRPLRAAALAEGVSGSAEVVTG